MRDREQVIYDFVKQWLKKAEGDMKTAELLLNAELNEYFTCAFHCQQAAEKFIKAFLVRHQIEFRKTYNLEELSALVGKIDPQLSNEIAFCKWLTPYGVEFRYPGEYPEVNKNTAEKAYKETSLVKDAVMKRLHEYLLKGRP